MDGTIEAGVARRLISRVRWHRAAALAGEGFLLADLDTHLAFGVREALPARTARAWARRVLERDQLLVEDFGGEQLCLGRAFYTHLETGRSKEYFRDARASDARVEEVLPGAQSFMDDLLARLVGGNVRRRFGFCGPGVHVFPANEKVARSGGVVHFDTEGLTEEDLARKRRAVSLVVMLQAPRTRGGVKLWDVTYRGRLYATERELSRRSTTTTYRAGDALLFSSHRLHQIQGFGGRAPRISLTVHGVEVDAGEWWSWF